MLRASDESIEAREEKRRDLFAGTLDTTRTGACGERQFQEWGRESRSVVCKGRRRGTQCEIGLGRVTSADLKENEVRDER